MATATATRGRPRRCATCGEPVPVGLHYECARCSATVCLTCGDSFVGRVLCGDCELKIAMGLADPFPRKFRGSWAHRSRKGLIRAHFRAWLRGGVCLRRRWG